MQYKLWKRTNWISYIYFILLIALVVYGLLNMDAWSNHRMEIIVALVLINVFFGIWYRWYDINVDRNMITKMTANGSIALAHIDNAVKFRMIRNSAGTKFYLWQIKAHRYDQYGQVAEISYIEKMNFDTHSIQQGHVYVTYDPNKVERVFTIPNTLLGVSQASMDKVKTYESSKLKIQYLNVYYKDGIIIERYADSLKKEQLRNQIAAEADQDEKSENINVIGEVH